MADIAEESPAQRAARLRREKREKKIMEGGSDRLAKITQTSGRQQDLQPVSSLKPNISDDPAEVDISTLSSSRASSSPTSTPGGVDEARLRAALRSQPEAQPQAPFAQLLQQQQSEGHGDAQADPMMQLMQQILGIPPPGGNGQTPFGEADGAGGGDLPPGLAALLGGESTVPGQRLQAPSTSGYIWRILHALFSLSMGLYVVTILPFNGSKMSRMSSSSASTQGVFWIFATIELGLQSARYMLERGKQQQTGWIGTIASVLPNPYKNYLLLAARYSGYWTTLVEDAMVVVFMLGVVAWWKGEVEYL